MKNENFLNKHAVILERIAALQEQNAYFYMHKLNSPQDSTIVINGRKFINFSSNNYLGLANDPRVKEAVQKALAKYGMGTGASRFLTGTSELHEKLELKLAQFKRQEAAVVFSTGYMANLGVLSSMFSAGDTLVIDKKCHASIIDGAVLSRAKIVTFSHNDMLSLGEKLQSIKRQNGTTAIITEGVFSMDGDIAPLDEIRKLADTHKASIIVDEAHSTGVLGEHGSGIVEYFKCEARVDIGVGTLSKALGGLGGFIVCDKDIANCLKHTARSFIFATSLPVPIVAGLIKALEIIEADPALIARLWKNIKMFKDGLREMKFDTLNSNSAIIPVFIGDEKLTHRIVRDLYDNGIIVNPVSFPAVEKNKSIIRISSMATHSKEALERALSVIGKIKEKVALN
ncbi:hypothetical protein A2625_01865 [candidate division WOR-1 bacterium RIFCSPHIGHO2_01_FULL_53_15]|uniref:Aminotransferase class I/classII large domain-containing protein n=1 Tax=candidate division WOR-1 bacterium RIFCSPHIGHO2_01_FULL_53_15 TaxID=1802564 RepID=A0A1F4Q2B9_UNCSA|nr:MAG: hypothetical protein A2625_01865 [candidate division WOR-1 bacterium RIFCSPHIGHO2_01_FULL_53_15]OGC13603.1 MAG: hypothetical protein A3D23_06140 [candidate division WOR-1 bacterium RIFCSPHIGHO2_02_FULL_53_26]